MVAVVHRGGALAPARAGAEADASRPPALDASERDGRTIEARPLHLGIAVRRLASILSILLLACASSTNPRSPSGDGAGDALRIVTWNVHDLFDEVDDTGYAGGDDEVPSAAEVRAKLDRVGRVLRRLDADVVVLQEVEHLALLERLAAGPLAGLGYSAWLVEGVDPRGIDVGLLSRRPPGSVRSHVEDRWAGGGRLFSRGVLEVHLQLGDRLLVLLGAHLVSRIDPSANTRRAAQAARIRALADGLRALPERPAVLVLGDLNDLPGSSALRPLLGDGAFTDLGAPLPSGDGWTWTGGGARERIDYMLVPREDTALVARFEVVSGEDVSTSSDHRPLLCDLWAPLAR